MPRRHNIAKDLPWYYVLLGEGVWDLRNKGARLAELLAALRGYGRWPARWCRWLIYRPGCSPAMDAACGQATRAAL